MWIYLELARTTHFVKERSEPFLMLGRSARVSRSLFTTAIRLTDKELAALKTFSNLLTRTFREFTSVSSPYLEIVDHFGF